MSGEIPLERLERIIDASGVPARIEALLPIGVRPRQLSVRTLLLGMLACLYDGRPAHLRKVHQALIVLSEQERRRLGIITQWNGNPHLLTYRQVERTFRLIVKALSKHKPDGRPAEALSDAMNALIEASVQVLGPPQSSALAVDWSDYESFYAPPRKRRSEGEQAEPAGEDAEPHAQGNERECADPEASWGHRRGNSPGQKDEAFYGYYLQAATIVTEENGEKAPELVRRISLTSCQIDPPGAFVPVLEQVTNDDIALGDVLADCGYAYRVAEDWAIPLRRLGAQLIQDIHPNDRGPKGTHMGAILANGNQCRAPASPPSSRNRRSWRTTRRREPGAGAAKVARAKRRCTRPIAPSRRLVPSFAGSVSGTEALG